MDQMSLQSGIDALEAGGWAVAVSGGADSVALLWLLRQRALRQCDLRLHVVHLDHLTRQGQSAQDARFVEDLCRGWGIACTIASRDEIERDCARRNVPLPGNLSSRFRACRYALFSRVVREQGLHGVALAHHADDQAETVFQRLLRGSPAMALGAMRARMTMNVGGQPLLVVRPLLGAAAEDLRQLLTSQHQPWREDASNASPAYQRNRVRALLRPCREVRDALLELGGACADLAGWIGQAAPVLAERFGVAELANLPPALAHEAARRWLASRGVPAGEISMSITGRLRAMARDAGTPARQHFPGRVLVRRRKGMIFVEEHDLGR